MEASNLPGDFKAPSGGIRDVLRIIFKYRGRMVVVFFIVFASVVLVTFMTPPVYEAKSALMVKFGREHIYRPELGEGRSPLFLTQEGAINSEIQILTSRDLLKKVVMAIGHEKMYGDRIRIFSTRTAPVEEAVLQFERNLRVENRMRSDVIQVSYFHGDPHMAAKVVNLLVDLFREKHLQVFSVTTTPFLEQQLAIYSRKLKDAETMLEAFKQKNRIYSIDEQRGFHLRRRAEVDTALMNIDGQIQGLQQRQAFLKTNAAGDPERAMESTRSRLLDLQLKERELLRRYKESSQTVTAVREEITIVKNTLEGLQQKNSVMEKLKVQEELNGLKLRQATLSKIIEGIDREIQDLDSKGREFQDLKGIVAMHESNYQTYLRKIEEARIAEDMDRQKIASISVIQTASIPAEPVKPRKDYNMLLGLVLGALSALGVGFLSEYSSQGLSTPESVYKKVELPVLASLPHKGSL